MSTDDDAAVGYVRVVAARLRCCLLVIAGAWIGLRENRLGKFAVVRRGCVDMVVSIRKVIPNLSTQVIYLLVVCIA